MLASKIVFCHYPCIDGAASAWAVQEAFPNSEVHCQGIDHNPANNFIYRPGGYERFGTEKGNDRQVIERTLESVQGSKEIYFIDYVPNDTAIIGELLEQGHKVRIFDHHDTAHSNLTALLREHEDNADFSVVFDRYKSGARITWDTLHPEEEAPELLKLVEKIDLLAFENDKEHKACCYIDGYINSPDQQENIYSFSALVDEYRRDGLEAMARKGEVEYGRWKKWRDRVISSARVIALGDQKVTIVPAGDIMEPPRGAKGLIGQGVCRMPPDVAERLGIIERQQWAARLSRSQYRQAGR
ncbi:MAG TPA: hypothetical protein VFT64_06895 [Rickettsiales bacterium]|nr:hypothetical protein [Rickettsiales bacterium]